jgi:hypothetical protein
LGECPGFLEVAPAQNNGDVLRVIDIAHHVGFIRGPGGLASRRMNVEAFFPPGVILDSVPNV